MERTAAVRAALPEWIRPQLTQLVQEAPDGDRWLHEIKFDRRRPERRHFLAHVADSLKLPNARG